VTAGSLECPESRGTARQTVLTLLVLLTAAAWGIGAALESWVTRERGSTKRNPHRERDWVHHAYDAEPRRPGERLIIVIGASQGYGSAVPDELTYPALLERDLAVSAAGGVRVLNWSIPGGVAPEFVVLTAAAQRLDPTEVLVLTSGGGFSNLASERRGLEAPLTGFASDSYRLAAFADVRDGLPTRFRDLYLGSTVLIDGLLARFSRLWRYRELPVRLLRPSWWLETVRYQRRRLRRFEGATRRQDEWRRAAPVDSAGQSRSFVIPKDREARHADGALASRGELRLRYDLLEDLLAAGPAGSRFALCLIPLRREGDTSNSRFVSEASQLASAAGTEIWDLSKTVPAREFESANHFAAAGHRRFARVLAERLGS